MVNGKEIDFLSEMKILGLIFDRRLTWAHHIENAVQNARRKLNILKVVVTSTTWGADEKTVLQMHQALILSVIE